MELVIGRIYSEFASFLGGPATKREAELVAMFPDYVVLRRLDVPNYMSNHFEIMFQNDFIDAFNSEAKENAIKELKAKIADHKKQADYSNDCLKDLRRELKRLQAS